MSETEQRTDGQADPGEMSLIEHLTELRNRIGIIMIGFIAIFLMCFIRPYGSDTQNIADAVYIFLQAPLADILLERGGRMIFTGLHEGFFTQVKVSFFCRYFNYFSNHFATSLEVCGPWSL